VNLHPEKTEAELESEQLEIAVAALAKIGFLTTRYPRHCAEGIARQAMAELSALQTKIEQIRNTPP
jgi:hypothetical protein